MHIVIQGIYGNEVIVSSDRIVLEKRIRSYVDGDTRPERERQGMIANIFLSNADTRDNLITTPENELEDAPKEEIDNMAEELFPSFEQPDLIQGMPQDDNQDANQGRPPVFKYSVLYNNDEMVEIEEGEYNRIKGILKSLNGELLKELEDSVLNDELKKEFKKANSALFRMEV